MKVIFLENYYLTIETFSVFISIKTDIFREFLPDNGDFIQCYIYQSYYQILYTFQRSYKPTMIFSEGYYQTIHTFQSLYIPILILSKSYYPTIHIFNGTYKPLLTNKTIETFSDFILNNINIFRELLTNNTHFFRLMSNNKHFQMEFLLIRQVGSRNFFSKSSCSLLNL